MNIKIYKYSLFYSLWLGKQNMHLKFVLFIIVRSKNKRMNEKIKNVR